jgi:ArsR family transcriptional regulator
MPVDMSLQARETAAIRVAKALADPTRFRLLRAIAASPEISCRELVERFPVAQATVSHHLKVLAEAGLVSARQEGPFHLYRAVEGALEAHGRSLATLAGPSRARARGGRR